MQTILIVDDEVLTALRADEAYRDIPLILMSAATPEAMIKELRPMITDFYRSLLRSSS